ncbi:AI-2E family transporter [Opitutus sp. GAS368]|uniref:AI-2E family transporter n=1 Tax=Opitutus sp. GAS368 TaxID=1882749 RepID=UPI00087A752F|nr:AI-2E family transporter [Opitutus sp. GAS368]SDS56408.1 Predicted PurR-regulated permease PerM [Opitutus sp. GAS368]
MSSEPTPLLSPAQRKLVGFALGFTALCAIGWLLYVLLAGVASFISAFSVVIWPLAVAGILALLMRPVVTVFEHRLKVKRPVAVVLLYLVFLLLVAGLLVTFLPVLVSEILEFIAYLPTLWQKTVAWSEQHFPEWLAIVRPYLDNPTVKATLDGLTHQAQDLLGNLAPTLKSAGAGIFGLFGFAASLAIIPVYLFFFLLSNDDPTQALPEHLPFLQKEHRDDVVFLVREFLGILVAFFRGQLLIGLIMGLFFATGFSLAGLKFGLAIGLLMGLLNIVPYLGSILGLSVALPLAYLQPDGGGLTMLGVCLGVFAAVQAIEGWFLTPRIMGKQTGLHPVVIIVAVFFWGKALGGVLGMMLAVPLTAFFVTAWRFVRRKYFAA